jgi:hypothetical protein
MNYALHCPIAVHRHGSTSEQDNDRRLPSLDTAAARVLRHPHSPEFAFVGVAAMGVVGVFMFDVI